MYLVKAENKGLGVYRSWLCTFPRSGKHDRIRELQADGGIQMTRAYYWLLSVLNQWYNGPEAGQPHQPEGPTIKEIEFHPDIFLRLLDLLDYRELISYRRAHIGDPHEFHIQVSPPPTRRPIYQSSSSGALYRIW